MVRYRTNFEFARKYPMVMRHLRDMNTSGHCSVMLTLSIDDPPISNLVGNFELARAIALSNYREFLPSQEAILKAKNACFPLGGDELRSSGTKVLDQERYPGRKHYLNGILARKWWPRDVIYASFNKARRAKRGEVIAEMKRVIHAYTMFIEARRQGIIDRDEEVITELNAVFEETSSEKEKTGAKDTTAPPPSETGSAVQIDAELEKKVRNNEKREKYNQIMNAPHENHIVRLCTCAPSRNEKLFALRETVWVHAKELEDSECLHIKAVASLDLEKGWLEIEESEELVVDGESTDVRQFHETPQLWMILSGNRWAGVIKVTKNKRTCIICHKESCRHIEKMRGEVGEMERGEEMDEDDDGPLKEKISWVDEKKEICSHGHRFSYRTEEIVMVNNEGLGEKIVMEKGTNLCCAVGVFPRPLVFTSGKQAVDERLLRKYSSLFAKAGVSMAGFYAALKEYFVSDGDDVTSLISRSSLQNAWGSYLDNLTIPASSFCCPECGTYPSTIVIDGVCLGSRADLDATELVRGSEVLRAANPGWILNKKTRKEIRDFGRGEGTIPHNLPQWIHYLLQSALLPSGQIDSRFHSLLNHWFSDTPVPDLLKVGLNGPARAVFDRLLVGKHDPNNLVHESEAIEHQPVLYRTLKPLWCNNALPHSVINAMKALIEINDTVYDTEPHPASAYGPIQDSQLDHFPLWGLQRGLAQYDKDKRQEEMECSRKILGTHSKLSPGLLLFCCPHRVCYGFQLLASSEGPRALFRVFMTRFTPETMPTTVLYDNSCHASAYMLSREPNFFSNTNFLIDRLHSHNHKTCARTLHLTEYTANPAMKALNSQACEQFNALLRHVNHVLPFLRLRRFIKSVALFMSKNQKSM